MSHYLELDAKRALVAGGTKGVGEGTVATLREAGAVVRVSDAVLRAGSAIGEVYR